MSWDWEEDIKISNNIYTLKFDDLQCILDCKFETENGRYTIFCLPTFKYNGECILDYEPCWYIYEPCDMHYEYAKRVLDNFFPNLTNYYADKEHIINTIVETIRKEAIKDFGV